MRDPVVATFCSDDTLEVERDPLSGDVFDPPVMVNVAAACAALSQWNLRVTAEARGAHIWEEFWLRVENHPGGCALPDLLRSSASTDPRQRNCNSMPRPCAMPSGQRCLPYSAAPSRLMRVATKCSLRNARNALVSTAAATTQASSPWPAHWAPSTRAIRWMRRKALSATVTCTLSPGVTPALSRPSPCWPTRNRPIRPARTMVTPRRAYADGAWLRLPFTEREIAQSRTPQRPAQALTPPAEWAQLARGKDSWHCMRGES